MKANKSIVTVLSRIGLTSILVMLGWVSPLMAQPVQGVQLVLEQNLTEGGTMTPNTGVYTYAQDTEIVITAIPEPGYRFAYWLGDVTTPGATSTHVQLSDSKAVVAVFEKISPDMLGEEDDLIELSGGGGGGGGSSLMPTVPNFFSLNYSIAGGVAQRPPQATSGPILINTPEPTTVLLFGLGGIFARHYRRRPHITT